MANQTTMTGNGAPAAGQRRSSAAGQVSHVAHDVIELAELQTRLFKLDVAATSARIRAALILAAAGAVILSMGCLIAFSVAGLALVEFADWTPTAAFGAVAIAVLLLSSILLFSAWRLARNGIFTWQRSRDELQKNIAWLKSTLAGKHLTTRNADAAARSN